MFVCLLDDLILGFCYRNLTQANGEFEFSSAITLVLQANRLTKCASSSISSDLIDESTYRGIFRFETALVKKLLKVLAILSALPIMESFLTKVILLDLGLLSVKSGLTYFQKTYCQKSSYDPDYFSIRFWIFK